MTYALIWLACGVVVMFILARDMGKLWLSTVAVSLLFGPPLLMAALVITVFEQFEQRGFDPVIWRRK